MPLIPPTAPTFCRPIADAGSKVATPARPIGGPTLTVLDGTLNGKLIADPSPSDPVRLTCLRASDGALLNLKATARSGNALTVAVADGTTDLALAIGDLVDVTGSAAGLADIHAAIGTAFASLLALIPAVNAGAASPLTLTASIPSEVTYTSRQATSQTGHSYRALAADGTLVFAIDPSGNYLNGGYRVGWWHEDGSSFLIQDVAALGPRLVINAARAYLGAANAARLAMKTNGDVEYLNANGTVGLVLTYLAGSFTAPNLVSTASAATGDECLATFTQTVNKASGNYTGVTINVIETSAPGTANRLLNLAVGGATRYSVDSNGAPHFPILADATARVGSMYLSSDHLDGAGDPRLCRKTANGPAVIG